MDNIYNFLKNVWQKEKSEIQSNPLVALISLTLITIPLHYRYNSISIILLAFFSYLNFKKNNFYIQKQLLLPIALYVVMTLSLFWTIDYQASSRAILKCLPLLLIPLIFFINPPLSNDNKNKVIGYFSYALLGYVIYYFIKAAIRFFLTKDTAVFFYHELVTADVNAIHVSVNFSIAFFWFLLKKNKLIIDKIALVIIVVLLILLSSKNIIFIFFVLLFFRVLKLKKGQITNTRKWFLLGIVLLLGVLFSGKIKDRILIEMDSNSSQKTINYEMSNSKGVVYNVSMKEAWTKERFEPNDYFPGTSLRVYQARIFKEMMVEDKVFLTGYGLNATYKKIKQKSQEHNLYYEYETYNFHNQYIQIFAELGLFGFLLLTITLFINLKNAIKTKHFIHFSFSILMISLFLTESYLARQRGILLFIVLFCLFNSRNSKK